MNEHLKHLSISAVNRLRDIFNACMSIGYFPTSWKAVTIRCILKPGKPASSPDSYRMISILSNIGKLYERVILNRLRPSVQDLRIVPSYQFGFVQGKSCTLQLLRTTRFIKNEMASRKSFGMLCIDLKSAFDVVWHDGLIHKMKNFGLPMSLIKIVRSFLGGRTFSVNVGSSLSSPQSISAGVPQGSVMAPKLFNVFISDVPTLATATYLSSPTTRLL